MLYLLCAITAVAFMTFAQHCASCYSVILQQGATPNAHSLGRAAWKAVTRLPIGFQRVTWPHSVWHRSCAVASICIGVFFATELLYGGWQRVTHGHVSIVVGLWYSVLTVMLLFLAWCDTYTRLLPDALTFPLMVLPWWVSGWSDVSVHTPEWAWWWGVAFCIGYCYGLPMVCRQWLGAGDVKLYLGLWAASPQPSAGIWLMVIATGSCWLIQAVWQRRCLPRGACAFGPYLCLAYSVINVWESSLSMEFSPYGF